MGSEVLTRATSDPMAAYECYHCKQWIEEGEPHDCWTTTEAALTCDLPGDLQDAWERLRETAVEFGDQRIYASHNSIMFSRKTCYFFVRPKRSHLEVCIFLGRPLKATQVRNVVKSSKTKFAHMLRVTHRDEVEAPITDWLREAYGLQDELASADPQGRPHTNAAVTKPRASATPSEAQRADRSSTRARRATRPRQSPPRSKPRGRKRTSKGRAG